MHHGVRDLAAIFPIGLIAGLHETTFDVLANSGADIARLHGPYANDQSVAAAEEMDLKAG